MSNLLTDSYGRKMRKLRVSLIDACNFRCTYCMPLNATFSKVHNLLTPDEIYNIVHNLAKLGLSEVRLTGGEPTLRREFLEITKKLSEISLEKLALTTNGATLWQYLDELKKTNLKYINISLDSLDPQKFKTLARFDGLSDVIKSIDQAVASGFHVKLNTVLMRENFSEAKELIEFARQRKIEIRFLELMKIGIAQEAHHLNFVPVSNLIFELRNNYKMKPLETEHDATAFKFELDSGAKVGFIASESMPFCGSCSRLRLDTTGALRSCLMKEDRLNLRNIGFDQYPAIVSAVIGMKPNDRVEKVDQPMYQIGG